ncbi:hypothetical protein [Asticcacaulis sp. 201]|uniref:hypothetical protein n=1 Tax=Asticcacaulis sp. 201 TaxID=3028787 RepID=UPI0029166EEB|nr:hypothetical protein [Asticcacaulis sp. 201]MDV6329822.1 hypothetical protein [Asticcacaulis sp. 201]
MSKLYDCCWVELEGRPRPELVIQKKLKPRLFIIGEHLYDENCNPLPTNPQAPRVLVIMHPQMRGRSRAG